MISLLCLFVDFPYLSGVVHCNHLQCLCMSSNSQLLQLLHCGLVDRTTCSYCNANCIRFIDVIYCMSSSVAVNFLYLYSFSDSLLLSTSLSFSYEIVTSTNVSFLFFIIVMSGLVTLISRSDIKAGPYPRQQ